MGLLGITMDYYGCTMEFLGITMELLWNYYGITIELHWNYYGITMESSGIHMERTRIAERNLEKKNVVPSFFVRLLRYFGPGNHCLN